MDLVADVFIPAVTFLFMVAVGHGLVDLVIQSP